MSKEGWEGPREQKMLKGHQPTEHLPNAQGTPNQSHILPSIQVYEGNDEMLKAHLPIVIHHQVH